MDGHADRRIERDGSQRDRVDRLMERERERQWWTEGRGKTKEEKEERERVGRRAVGALNFVSIDGVA